MKQRHFVVLTLALFSVFILSACTAQQADVVEATAEYAATQNEEAQEQIQEEIQAQQPTQRVITDQMGREVVLPDGPLTIGLSRRTMLFTAINAGALDSIVSLSGFASGSILEYAAPYLRYAAVITGTGTNINLEELANVNPDVFLVSIPDAHAVLESLELLGIPAVVLNPEDFENIAVAMDIIGYLANNQAQATAVVELFNQNLQLAATAVTSATHTPTALMLGTSPLLVHPAGMIQHDVITAAGAINVAGHLDGLSTIEMNIEEILEWNPEYIFITAFGALEPSDILEDSRFAQVTAVLNNNVFKFPSELDWWDTPSAAVSLGVLWATHKMHPDLITFDQLNIAVGSLYYLIFGTEFGQEFFGY